MRQLFLDMDGVLADFDGHYAEVFGAPPPRDHPTPPDFWPNIERRGSFFADLQPMPDAHLLVQEARRLHANPIVLTGLPKGDLGRRSELEKITWLRRWFGDLAILCCRSKDKAKFCRPGDIIVDDWAKYRHLLESAGGLFVLHSSAQASIEALVGEIGIGKPRG